MSTTVLSIYAIARSPSLLNTYLHTASNKQTHLVYRFDPAHNNSMHTEHPSNTYNLPYDSNGMHTQKHTRRDRHIFESPHHNMHLNKRLHFHHHNHIRPVCYWKRYLQYKKKATQEVVEKFKRGQQHCLGLLERFGSRENIQREMNR